LMMSGVGSAISKEKGAIDSSVKTVQSTKAPGKGKIDDLEKQKGVLQVKKGDLWKENWDRQKKYFTWPATKNGIFDKYADLKYGDRLRETSNEFEDFKSNYHEMFRQMAGRVKPTRFAGEWISVLRWVSDWGQRVPTPEQIWVAMEDVWIQRALLEPIKTVNDQTAAFALVPDAKDTPLKRHFRSRVWDLTLEVADLEPGKAKFLKGKLKNRTPQLQLLGVNNIMRLNVWLDPRPGSPPVPFEVQGEYVGGDAEIEVPYLQTHNLLGTVPTEIAKVEQVLDERTVPVRRIDQLVIGYKSARHFSQELKYPEFWKEDAPATTGTMPGTTGATPTGSPDGSAMRGAMSMPGAGGGVPGMAGSTRSQSGPPAAVIDANRKRYLEWTDQVRRVPVALVLVVDQMFIPDVLIAYANSDFRFWTVQTHWKRFHGSLATQSPTGSTTNIPGGMGTEEGPSIGGIVGGDLLRGGFNGPGTGMSMPGGGFGGPGGPGFPGFGGFPGSGGGGTSMISEAQANAGLVELTIYGVISLYQKVEEKKDAAEAPKAEAPKEEPKADAPKTGETKPVEATKPATGDPKSPDAPKPAAGDTKAPEAPKPMTGDEKGADPKAPAAPPNAPPPANPPAPSPPGNPKM
jgi:hypothetical protein